MTPYGHAGMQLPHPLQTSACTTTVPNSVRNSAPVGQTSRQAACVQCLHTSELISQRTPSPPGAWTAVGACCSMKATCKHCTHAACLDVCPTGALFRTEFGTVVVQADVCNGCGNCIPACPYGVIDQREGDGRAWKCTLCYDRIGDGLMPAC